MRYTEFKNVEPSVGDILGLEFGDTLIEAVIEDIRDDGVVIKLDEAAVRMISEIIPPSGRRTGTHDDDEEVISHNYSGIPIKKADLRVVGKDYVAPEEPKVEPTPEPRKRPVMMPDYEPETDEACDAAIKWGRKTLKNLDITLRSSLASHGEQAVLEYLKIVAREENAYDHYKFSVDDLTRCRDALADVFDDDNVKGWADVLKLTEAEYHGRKVPLGKPMKGDVKKSKVYVKGPKGNVVKVNFGDPNMRIKKSSPKHRKSFRARHNCDNPGPRTKARYWSCRAW